MHMGAIYRYPVKGLGPETLQHVMLSPDAALPGDRVFAISHGASHYDPAAPQWVSCRNFVTVRHTPALATAQTSFDPKSGRLTVRSAAMGDLTADLSTAEGREALGEWVGNAPQVRPGPYRIAQAPGQAMTDMEPPFVSINTIASLEALSTTLGIPTAPHRFRGNFWIADADPWAEESWIGREITVGDARLRVEQPIGRCRAPDANPATGQRDTDMVKALTALRGEPNFGVYARVIKGGVVALEAPVALDPSRDTLTGRSA